MLFNVYYLNFSKVYEIKMMLSNVIKIDKTVETSQGDTLDAELQAKMGTKFLKLFSADIGSDIKSGSSDSQKVLENFKVTMTKSLILNESKENFKKKISPELRSRFDYKGMFNLLTDEDKRKFVHFRVNQIISKYREFVSHDLPEKLHDNVVARIDVSNYKNMRDLNKKIKDTFVELIGS